MLNIVSERAKCVVSEELFMLNLFPEDIIR